MQSTNGKEMTSLELTSAVTAIANALACSLTDEQTALLASVLVQLGDTLTTILACKNQCSIKLEHK